MSGLSALDSSPMTAPPGLPNLGPFGNGHSRQNFFSNDWQLPSSVGLGQPPGASADVAALLGGGPAMRPLTALQEAALPPNEPQQANGDANSAWLMEMFGGGGGGSSKAATAGGLVPQAKLQQQVQASAQPQLLPFQGVSGFSGLGGLGPQGGGGLHSPGARPLLQQQPQQQRQQQDQQELWRKGLFSEVFDQTARTESPFHIPDLADIEAPDVDDLLLGGIGLGDPLESIPLLGGGSSPMAMVGSGAQQGPGSGGFTSLLQPGPGLALTQQLHNQLQTQQHPAAGLGSSLAAVAGPGSAGPGSAAPQQRRASGSPLFPPQQQQQQQQLGPLQLIPSMGGQQQQQQQQLKQEAGGRSGLASPTAARKGGSKKVTSKKAASKKKAGAGPAAVVVAAAKRARQARYEAITVVEWCTEEDPTAQPTDLAGPPPEREPLDPAALQLSPAAALVAAAPATACGSQFKGGGSTQGPEAQRDKGGGSLAPMQLLSWLFGPACPKRWRCLGGDNVSGAAQ